GTSVLNLTAEDGDYGNPRNLSYRLDKENPWSSHFSVNPQTGEVRTTRPIAELADKYGGTAVYILKVAVRETTGTAEYPAQEASTQFAVVLMSRENHAPAFGSDLYVGFVAEHSAHLTAVDWAPGVSPRVQDRDQLVAAETEAVEPLTSTVTVRVNIVDTNDHAPMFSKDTYEAVVAEDAKKGTLVTTVTATDPDSGSFGKVRYTSLNGPIARNLKLDPETGEVTLVSSEGLDRESVPEYVLVVEAHDDEGRGQRATAQLRILVGDANDNAPAFAQSRYDAVLTADLADFTEPLVVKATDADAPGPNSNVTYEIVSGNYEQKFRIDPRTGLVSLTAPLTSAGKSPVVLAVRAHDHGIPVQSASVPVRVHTQEYLNRSIVVVLPGNEAQLRERKDHIEKGLSELLGANVNIYSIMPHNQSKDASNVRAWAVYESQPIDLVSFRRIISNLHGKQYERLSQEEETVKKAGNDRIFWIFIIVLILLILLILLIMLCCCWKYLLRQVKPSPSAPDPAPGEYHLTFRLWGVTRGAQGHRHTPKETEGERRGARRRWDRRMGRTGQGSKARPRPRNNCSLCKATNQGHVAEEKRQTKEQHSTYLHPRESHSVQQGISPRNQSQGGGVLRLRTPDRQLLLHEMRREPDRTTRQVGNYLVVKRDNARQHHREDAVMADDEDVDAVGSGDRFRHQSGVSDSFGTRTEILYIRSPPPGDDDVGVYADQGTERLGATTEDGGNLRLRASRRENARRVRFSRYHKVDGGSFVLPQSNGEDTSVLPRDQVWIVPRETKPKQDAAHDADVHASLTEGRAHVDRKQDIRDAVSKDNSGQHLQDTQSQKAQNLHIEERQVPMADMAAVEPTSTGHVATESTAKSGQEMTSQLNEGTQGSASIAQADDSDSGIGPGASNLRLKKNAFIEKKSLFTIAYNGVNTQKLRSSLGSTPSP
ncbi:unnamed protein product, partial [Ixodes hexagonus]